VPAGFTEGFKGNKLVDSDAAAAGPGPGRRAWQEARRTLILRAFVALHPLPLYLGLMGVVAISSLPVVAIVGGQSSFSATGRTPRTSR
jgi:hypothetical protein